MSGGLKSAAAVASRDELAGEGKWTKTMELRWLLPVGFADREKVKTKVRVMEFGKVR